MPWKPAAVSSYSFLPLVLFLAGTVVLSHSSASTQDSSSFSSSSSSSSSSSPSALADAAGRPALQQQEQQLQLQQLAARVEQLEARRLQESDGTKVAEKLATVEGALQKTAETAERAEAAVSWLLRETNDVIAAVAPMPFVVCTRHSPLGAVQWTELQPSAYDT